MQDMLSDPTRRARRTLISTSLIALLLTSQWVKFNSFTILGGVKVSPPQELFPLILVIVLGYQFISFGWYWLDDFRSIEVQEYFGSLGESERQLKGIADVIEQGLKRLEDIPEKFDEKILTQQRQYLHVWGHLEDKVKRAKTSIK